MPLTLNAVSILEKNRLSSDGNFLVMLEIALPSGTVLRLVRNNENITWNGSTWVAFPFEIDTLGEQKAEELPRVVVKVGNVNRVMQYYLEIGIGGVGAEVKIFVVHSDHTDINTPEIELEFECKSTSSDNQWATFNLGAPDSYKRKIPRDRLMKRFCRHKEFGGIYCKYEGTEETCDRTYEKCAEYGNLSNFGGAPGLGSGGLKI